MTYDEDGDPIKFHYVLTLQGGSTQRPWTKTWTDVIEFGPGDTRNAVFEDILHTVWQKNRELPWSDDEDPVVLFYSVERDRLT
ncbi:MAG: hypothetical protein ACLPKI_24040 [Streptosporangiaceae bacterium]